MTKQLKERKTFRIMRDTSRSNLIKLRIYTVNNVHHEHFLSALHFIVVSSTEVVLTPKTEAKIKHGNT